MRTISMEKWYLLFSFFQRELPPLEYALSTDRMLVDRVPNAWQKSWFPIFGNEDKYAVVIEDRKNREAIDPSIVYVDDIFEVI